jgi:hypothetical protein
MGAVALLNLGAASERLFPTAGAGPSSAVYEVTGANLGLIASSGGALLAFIMVSVHV